MDKKFFILKLLSFLSNSNIQKNEHCYYLELEAYEIPISILYIIDFEKFLSNHNNNKILFLITEAIDLEINFFNLEKDFYFFLFDHDIVKLENTFEKLKDLLIYKIYNQFILQKPSQETLFVKDLVEQFSESLRGDKTSLREFNINNRFSKLEEHPRNFVNHYRLPDLKVEVIEKEFKSILIIGDSGSGKTSLAYQLGSSLEKRHFNIFFLEAITLNNINLPALLIDLISHLVKNDKRIILIVDDLHSNLYAIERLAQILNFIQHNGNLSNNLCFIGITWPEFTKEIEEKLEKKSIVYSLNTEDIAESIIAHNISGITASETGLILQKSENNLLLLKLILGLLKEEKSSLEEVLENLPNYALQKLDLKTNEDKRIIYLTAILGKYEIDISKGFISEYADVDQNTIDKLTYNNKLRKRGSRFTLGHKTFCKLIYQSLSEDKILTNWFKEKQISTSNDILVEFLRRQQPNTIFSIIKKLYKNTDEKLTDKQDTILNTWHNIDYIVENLLIQNSLNPNWNNTISSVTFAVQALTTMGYVDNVKESINYLRNLYRLTSKKLILDISQETNKNDFKKIKEIMVAQDKIENLSGEKGRNIDTKKFHTSWAKGLILGAEHYYGDIKNDELQKFCVAVENEAIDGEYFYPERVVWSTARILIGLGLCNRTIKNSKIVKNVAEWLLDHPNYNSVECYWESGTGSWNNWIEATSLTIIGLVSVGVSKEHPRIKHGIEKLYSVKDEWIRPNQELDGVLALQAYSRVAGLAKVLKELNYLSDWIKNNSTIWNEATKGAGTTNEQSCKVSQIAAGLIDVLWQDLNNDLPRLVSIFESKKQENTKKVVKIFVSYSWDSDEHKNWVVNIFLKALYKHYGKNNVFIDINKASRDTIVKFMDKAIEESDYILTVITPNYKNRSIADIGGVQYEINQIANIALHGIDKTIIPILREGDWGTTLPGPTKNQIGIDFRKDDEFFKKFQELVNLIN